MRKLVVTLFVLAVIGGLLFATPTTLLVVPWLYARLRAGSGRLNGAVFEEVP